VKTRGFTLIELLVAISIIALLIGVLLPALGAARGLGRQAACLSNLRQHGVAYMTYANDWAGKFPHHEWWYNHIGPSGNLAEFGRSPFGPIDQMGLANEPGTVVERVLNDYVEQQPEVARCPGDAGDSKWEGVTECFEAYGSSYQAQWHDNGLTNAPFGVVPVNGGATIVAGPARRADTNRPSARVGEAIVFRGVAYAGTWSNKIVHGDFNWHGNRPIDDPRVLWHPTTQKGVRKQNMLFGDGHAEFFDFGPNYGDYDLPVDQSANGFW